MKALSIASQFIEAKFSSSVWGKVWLVFQAVIIRRRWMCLRIAFLGEDVTEESQPDVVEGMLMIGSDQQNLL